MLPIEQRLARHPFLKGVSGACILVLAEDTVPMVFQPGETIFRQGGRAHHLFLVEKGLVEVGMLKKGRSSPVVVTHVGKGGSLGWSWAFPPYRWRFDARAKTRVETLALEGRPLMDKLGRYPVMGYEVMHHLARSLAQGLEATRHQLVKYHHRAAKKGVEVLYFPTPIV